MGPDAVNFIPTLISLFSENSNYLYIYIFLESNKPATYYVLSGDFIYFTIY